MTVSSNVLRMTLSHSTIKSDGQDICAASTCRQQLTLLPHQK